MSKCIDSAQPPDLRPALEAAAAFVERNGQALSESQQRGCQELQRRLLRLEADCHRLIALNNHLLSADLPSITFNEATGVMTIHNKGEPLHLQLNRADPNVPVQLVGSAALATYGPGPGNRPATSEMEAQRLELESALEQFYNSAFRATKLLQEIVGVNQDCRPITMVRNKLVEHPQDAASYNFGYGTNGPVVKPVKMGPSEWSDDGLVPNTVAFVQYATKLLSR